MSIRAIEAIEAIRVIMPITAEYLESGDDDKVYAAIMNATGGFSNRDLTLDQAHELIAHLQAAAPDVFAAFQKDLRQNMAQLGYEPGAYDTYIVNLS